MVQWIGLRENLQENHGFYHQIWGFPLNFPIIQFYDNGWGSSLREIMEQDPE
jgi:hypothetical protein